MSEQTKAWWWILFIPPLLFVAAILFSLELIERACVRLHALLVAKWFDRLLERVGISVTITKETP